MIDAEQGARELLGDDDEAQPWAVVVADIGRRQADAEQWAAALEARAQQLREVSAAYRQVISWARAAAVAAETEGVTDG